MNEKEIVRKYLNGATQKELAKEFKTFKAKIRNILLEHRIKLRSHSEAQKLRKHDSEFSRLTEKEKKKIRKIYDEGYSINYIHKKYHYQEKTLRKTIKQRLFGETVSLAIKKFGHPRGMLGKHHKKSIKEQLSKRWTGERNPKWKGGRRKDNKGYIRISLGKGKRRYEHDLIMEKKLGRKLKKGEVSHHKNEKRSDNRPRNLKLKTLGTHTTFHLTGKLFCLNKLKRNVLRKKYILEKKSLKKVAEELNSSGVTIRKYLEHYKIPVRKYTMERYK